MSKAASFFWCVAPSFTFNAQSTVSSNPVPYISLTLTLLASFYKDPCEPTQVIQDKLPINLVASAKSFAT